MASSGSGEHCQPTTAEENDEHLGVGLFEPLSPTRIPSHLVIPHRLGNTTLHLSETQRCNREMVETVVLYKELKHNSVNAFHRFVLFLLCLLVPSLFCHAFGLSSAEWVVTSYSSHFQSIGFFSACREAFAGVCTWRANSLFSRVLRDRLSGEVVCEVSDLFARAYIGAMWTLGIVQVLCVLLTLFTAVRIASRPTRSCSSLLAMCFMLTAVPCGVANCVLFYFYTRCDRRECEAMHLGSSKCVAFYGWGYVTHIVATSLDFFALIAAFCLWVYPRIIRTRVLHLLAQQRKLEHEKEHDRWRQRERTMSAEHTVTNDRLMRTILLDQDGVPYLTARELGAVIDGADDWVYDHKSDLFYSFVLEMFWDPQTFGYYSCALQSWQVTPDGLVGLNRADTK